MSTHQRLDALTGLRFLAAVQVVCFHTAPRGAGVSGAALGLLDSGYVGVGLFYILSGFVLAFNYLPAAEQGALDYRAFLQARFARVYPVYAFALLVALPTLVKFTWVSMSSGVGLALLKGGATFLANVLLVQSWLTPTVAPWNAPGWSLSNEAFFYALFPFAAALVVRLRTRGVVGAMVACWLAVQVAPILYEVLGGAAHDATLGHRWTMRDFVRFNPVLRLPEFLIGVLLGHGFLSWRAAATQRSWVGPAASMGGLVLALLILAHSAGIPYLILHNGLLAPVFALLVFGLAVGGGPLARFLRTPVMQKLGEASYALYILHIPLHAWARNLLAPFGLPDRAPRAFFLGYLVVSLALSLLVLRHIEEPARRRLRPRTRVLAREDTPVVVP